MNGKGGDDDNAITKDGEGPNRTIGQGGRSKSRGNLKLGLHHNAVQVVLRHTQWQTRFRS